MCSIYAFREAYKQAKAIILEPIMTVEVVAPSEFQSSFLLLMLLNLMLNKSLPFVGAVIGGLNSRRGQIMDSEVRDDEFVCTAEVALNDMFGYSNQLRGATQGKGALFLFALLSCR